MDFSVPQGSTQGAYLFICYASTLNKIVPKSLTLNGFADDHSIRNSFKPTVPKTNSSSVHTDEDDTITIMENSMLNIKSWMDAVKLKLNETKTEFIYFGGKHQLAKTQRDTININGGTIQCTNKIKYLGGHLNSSLTFKDHIIAKSKAVTISIIKIRNIRKYLNQDTCHKLVITLVLSHLDSLQFTAIRTTRFQHKDTIKSPKQCSKISPGKKCKTHLNRKHKATTLAPNKTMH